MSKFSVIKEFWDFAKSQKKYFLFPLIILFVLLGMLLIFAQSSAVAPFIYTLF